MGVVGFTNRSLYSREITPRYPLDRRLNGPQSLSERGGEDKKSLFLPGIGDRSSSQ